MTLRIALDVTPELIGSTGVARYSRELRRALQRRGDCEIHPFAVGRRFQPLPAGVRHLPVPLRVIQRSWAAVELPRAEHLAGAVDLVHSLDLVPPPSARPLVVTVHDVVTAERPISTPPGSAHAGRAVAALRARRRCSRSRTAPRTRSSPAASIRLASMSRRTV